MEGSSEPPARGANLPRRRVSSCPSRRFGCGDSIDIFWQRVEKWRFREHDDAPMASTPPTQRPAGTTPGGQIPNPRMLQNSLSLLETLPSSETEKIVTGADTMCSDTCADRRLPTSSIPWSAWSLSTTSSSLFTRSQTATPFPRPARTAPRASSACPWPGPSRAPPRLRTTW